MDGSLCNGHGLCQVMSPAVYKINPDSGMNEAGSFEVADELRPAAQNGASACPERAIALLRDAS